LDDHIVPRIAIDAKDLLEQHRRRKMVVFLAGESAGFMTGERIPVNRGNTLA
jgi:hypothetical protein